MTLALTASRRFAIAAVAAAALLAAVATGTSGITTDTHVGLGKSGASTQGLSWH